MTAMLPIVAEDRQEAIDFLKECRARWINVAVRMRDDIAEPHWHGVRMIDRVLVMLGEDVPELRVPDDAEGGQP